MYILLTVCVREFVPNSDFVDHFLHKVALFIVPSIYSFYRQNKAFTQLHLHHRGQIHFNSVLITLTVKLIGK